MLRKLKTEAEVARIRKRNNLIIGVVMIGLLALAPFGYSLINHGQNQDSNQGSSLNEKGYDFFYINGQWRTEINGQVYAFTYLPSEVEDVDVQGFFILSGYVNSILYIVNGDEGNLEVLNNLGRYSSRYQEACIEEELCEGDFPMKTCEDHLIVFKEGVETTVSQDLSCVYITGDQVKGTDAFLYKLLNIN